MSSRPSSRLLIRSGKRDWISAHLSWFTNVFVFEFLRTHTAIRTRHMGQFKLVSLTWVLKHWIHNSCLQGICTGSTRISKQIGHIKSVYDLSSDSSFNLDFLPFLLLIFFFCLLAFSFLIWNKYNKKKQCKWII